MVLLKGHDARGFVFYTNRASRKAAELEANPRAAAALYWEPQDRQVRVEGTVEPVSDDESLAYFRTRPRDSRIGAWASPQSRRVASRAELEQRVAEIERRFAGEDDVPLPPFWGGYRIVADDDRVLAGTAEPAPRPRALRAERRRAGAASGSARTRPRRLSPRAWRSAGASAAFV